MAERSGGTSRKSSRRKRPAPLNRFVMTGSEVTVVPARNKNAGRKTT